MSQSIGCIVVNGERVNEGNYRKGRVGKWGEDVKETSILIGMLMAPIDGTRNGAPLRTEQNRINPFSKGNADKLGCGFHAQFQDFRGPPKGTEADAQGLREIARSDGRTPEARLAIKIDGERKAQHRRDFLRHSDTAQEVAEAGGDCVTYRCISCCEQCLGFRRAWRLDAHGVCDSRRSFHSAWL